MEAQLPPPHLVQALRPHLPHDDAQALPEVLDIGYSSRVIAFGGTVARAARTRQAEEGHRREALLLPVLAGRVPLAVPEVVRLVDPSPALQFGALLQVRLPGRRMRKRDADRPRASIDLALTLKALHAIALADVPPGSIRRLDPTLELERLESETFGYLQDRMDPARFAALGGRWRRAERVLPEHPRVLAHGDAWYGNVLVDDGGRPSALLDFEDACEADPALDLAALFHADRRAAEAAVSAYVERSHAGPHLAARIEGYRLLREVADLAYLLRNHIEDEVEDSVSKIEQLLAMA